MFEYTRLPKYFCRYYKALFGIKGMAEEEIHVERRTYREQPPTDDQRVIDFVEPWIEPPASPPNPSCLNLRSVDDRPLARYAVLPLTRQPNLEFAGGEKTSFGRDSHGVA
jgi:hypothetical protein